MWKDLIYQKKIAGILQKAVAGGRVSHAYLFMGSKGSGKGELALQLAKSLLCLQGGNGDSCDTCRSCKRIETGNHSDVYQIRPEGGSIKLEQIRLLQEEFSRKTVESPRKICIIHQAESMTKEAQNRLLKFLEEPTGSIVAILLTERPQQLLPTIHSRCQTFHLLDKPWKEIAMQVEKEGVGVGEARVAALIAGNQEEALNLCQKESFAELRQRVIKFYQRDWEDRGKVLTAFHEEFVLNELLKDEIPLFFDLTLIWHRDALQFMLGRTDEVANLDFMAQLKDWVKPFRLTDLERRMTNILDGRWAYESSHSLFALEQMILQM
ncbi:MAG: DNA polymerase III subunit delta' [Thermicanus sp.]|nr:DNA polymerase III subunit delta' [Thermicanus sp.]